MECKRCEKKITKKDKAVLWKTFKVEEVLEEVYWHYQCFLDWRDESLENRAKKIYANTMKECIPQLKGMLGGLLGNNEEETKENNIYEVGIV